MQLRLKHKEFCKLIAENEFSATEAYCRSFNTTNRKTAAPCASRLLEKKEILDEIEKFKEEKSKLANEIALASKAQAITEMKAQILNDIELDYFHSQVVRGEVEIEELWPVREYIPLTKDDPRSGRWLVSFKKVKRLPNVREKQISASELYKRMGSYATPKAKLFIEDDRDERDKTPKQDVIILSDGTTIPFPQ